jgi:hypothetical protein
MLHDRHVLDDESCPVSDDFLGELYRGNEHGLPALVATVAPELRAELALYCYRRAHLHSIGLAIASTCDEEVLVGVGGRMGAVVFARSREAAPSARPVAQNRRKVSLSTGLLQDITAFADAADEEADVAEENASAETVS